MKANFFILCDVIFLVRLQGKFEIDHSWEWKGYGLQFQSSPRPSKNAQRLDQWRTDISDLASDFISRYSIKTRREIARTKRFQWPTRAETWTSSKAVLTVERRASLGRREATFYVLNGKRLRNRDRPQIVPRPYRTCLTLASFVRSLQSPPMRNVRPSRIYVIFLIERGIGKRKSLKRVCVFSYSRSHMEKLPTSAHRSRQYLWGRSGRYGRRLDRIVSHASILARDQNPHSAVCQADVARNG